VSVSLTIFFLFCIPQNGSEGIFLNCLASMKTHSALRIPLVTIFTTCVRLKESVELSSLRRRLGLNIFSLEGPPWSRGPALDGIDIYFFLLLNRFDYPRSLEQGSGPEQMNVIFSGSAGDTMLRLLLTWSSPAKVRPLSRLFQFLYRFWKRSVDRPGFCFLWQLISVLLLNSPSSRMAGCLTPRRQRLPIPWHSAPSH